MSGFIKHLQGLAGLEDNIGKKEAFQTSAEDSTEIIISNKSNSTVLLQLNIKPSNQTGVCKMNNETKQQMINFYNNQIKAHRMEIDKLTKQEETVKQSPMFGQALTLGDGESLLSNYGEACGRAYCTSDELNQGNIFTSKEAAELEGEKRKLRQLARLRMAQSWGEERPVWGEKWVWCLLGGQTEPVELSCFRTLHFRTKEHAQSFLDEVGSDGIHKILEL